MQRVGGCQIRVKLFVDTIVKQRAEARARVDPVMKFAPRAHLQVFVERFLPNDLPAAFALQPEALGANTLLFSLACGIYAGFLSIEPCHGNTVLQ